MDEINELLLSKNKILINSCYERTCHMLLSLIKSIVKCETDALDIFQSAYKRLIIALPQISTFSENQVDAYLVTIAKNLCYKFLKNKKRIIPTDKLDTLLSGINVQQSIEDADLTLYRRRCLHEALNRISQRYRYFIQLKYYLELKNQEISQLMHLSEDNIRKLHSRAIKSLRKEYQHIKSME